MRTFIAIDFDSEVKQYLEEVQKQAESYAKRGNFSKKENYHLTLRFLGEVEQEELSDIAIAMKEAATQNHAFHLQLMNLGSFHKSDGTSILWVGLKDNALLKKLYFSLEKSLSKQGFARDRQLLSPHVTLGRQVEFHMNERTVVEKISVEPKTIPVTKITLMQSIRQGKDLIYKPLFEQALKEKREKKQQ